MAKEPTIEECIKGRLHKYKWQALDIDNYEMEIIFYSDSKLLEGALNLVEEAENKADPTKQLPRINKDMIPKEVEIAPKFHKLLLANMRKILKERQEALEEKKITMLNRKIKAAYMIRHKDYIKFRIIIIGIYKDER